MHCGQMGTMSSWHILGECQAPSLVATRAGVTQRVRARVRQLTSGRPDMCNSWLSGLDTTATGSWLRPEGWRTPADQKAGVHAIPWYGCFPHSWLNRWGELVQRGAAADHWEEGIRILREISGEAVRGCHLIWKEATRLWSA